MTFLEKGYEKRGDSADWQLRQPINDPLRSDPRGEPIRTKYYWKP